MNAKQQEIINSLIAEFNRIETSSIKNNSFNLIDLESLKDKTWEIDWYKKVENEDIKAWKKIATEEAHRLVELFKQDLPTACVKFCDGSSLFISNTNSKNRINIHVHVIRDKDVEDSYGNCYSRGKALSYGVFERRYRTIEDLVQNKDFLELIRTKIIS